jgi:hypothetical protein
VDGAKLVKHLLGLSKFVRLLAMGLVTAFLVLSATSAQAQDLPGYKIRIVQGSNLTLVSSAGLIPVVIENGYDTAVRVQIHVRPTNLRLSVPQATEVVVPANTTYTATVAVQALADGDVELVTWLTTFSGLRLGPSVTLKMTVNAEVEANLLIAFSLLVVALLGAGAFRTVRRKRLAA